MRGARAQGERAYGSWGIGTTRAHRGPGARKRALGCRQGLAGLAAGAHGARRVRGTGDGRAAWACCWANRLCTLCTQPVLTQFRLNTVLKSIFGEIFFKQK